MDVDEVLIVPIRSSPRVHAPSHAHKRPRLDAGGGNKGEASWLRSLWPLAPVRGGASNGWNNARC